jgi:hypothetical protein
MFARAQNPCKFSRDPYIQLENHYESVGDDNLARKLYYKGRCDVRANATAQNKWHRSRNGIDWLWKVLTGYGVNIRPLLAIAGIFILAGMLFFYPNDALTRVTASASSYHWEEGPVHQFLYSLDLFLPIVNLRVDELWLPNGPWWLHLYATIHALVGWLIVPLLVAALAGIIRR